LALVSMSTAAQVAVAGEQGIENQQRATMLEVAAGPQSASPAEWRADRYLAMPSTDHAGAKEQAGASPLIPAEWRADRYLAMPSMDHAGAKGQANVSPLAPAEWRADRYLAMPSMAGAGDYRVLGQGMGAGSC
jgi:hypothetical protein